MQAIDIINCILPDFIYKENQYKDSEIFIKTTGDTLKMNGTVKKKMNNGNFFDLAVTAEAADNKTKADIMIDNHDELQHLNGIISTETQFFYNEEGKVLEDKVIEALDDFLKVERKETAEGRMQSFFQRTEHVLEYRKQILRK